MNQLKRTVKVATMLSFIIMYTVSFGQSKNNFIRTPDGRKIEASVLNQYIQKAMDSIKIPGISIAIVNKNDIVYHKTFGIANTETKKPVDKQTIFEGASLSKPLFAYFLMKMVEKGALDLDKSIYPYLKSMFTEGVIAPESLTAYKTLTPRIILSHGSGIPNWVRGKPITIAFEPGTDFSYSGEAYQHLGAAFGRKLGIGWGPKLDSLFIKEAAHPIGMNRSLYTWNTKYDKDVARGHIDGKMTQEINKYKRVGPGFSLHSDAQDYAMFLIEMMNPKNIKKSTRDEMLKEHNHFKSDSELLKETGQTGWGLGFAQKPTSNGLMHLHTGNNQDFQAYAMFIPEQEYGFVMFGNSNNLFPLLNSIEQLIGEHF
ncbi:serine hydrolase domain-containing protein [Aquimarina sp. 2201CG14-23]|uniref:serine hydrolase domain-containing protein n=1 Tax=Aquimarina mycalae TaxID=3040073 RepID=UPI002477CE8E|nr:serine hydrolase domain-containing protein [Aquimarina sp. 2201CG14-23]MDH7444382.1 serine hydrolase domain-containing protein [Aquimarina sp. 2201CG14-23]